MKRLAIYVVAALILSVAQAQAQQPTFAQIGGGNKTLKTCSGAQVYGALPWCFDWNTQSSPGIYYNNAGTWTLLIGGSGTSNVGELTINTGITPSSTGYNAFTIATNLCTTTGAGGTCAEPTQTVTFPDANYFINCTCNGTSAGIPAVSNVSTKASNAVVVTIVGVTAVSASCGKIDCVAIHQ